MNTEHTFILTYSIEGEDSGKHYTKEFYGVRAVALKVANKWLRYRPGCTYLSFEQKTEQSTEIPNLQEAAIEKSEATITVYLYIMTVEGPIGIRTLHPFYAPDLLAAWVRANAFYDKSTSINQEYREVVRRTTEFKIESPSYKPIIYQPEKEMTLADWESITRGDARG